MSVARELTNEAPLFCGVTKFHLPELAQNHSVFRLV